MESNYLKAEVGPVLAKAVAETVVARPQCPTEYLALYLLHHIQEEELKKRTVATATKAEGLRSDCAEAQKEKEKLAVDLIQKRFRTFRGKIEQKKKEQQTWLQLYEESTGEAEDLLERLPPVAKNANADNEDAANNTNPETLYDEEHWTPGAPSLMEVAERLDEARRAFFVQQKFICDHLQKKELGDLKQLIVDRKEFVARGCATAEQAKDSALAAEEEALEAAAAADAAARRSRQTAEPALPPAAHALAAALLAHHGDHAPPPHANLPYLTYLLLKCVLYLLQGSKATPKATGSVTQLAQLCKPTLLAKQLKAYNPVKSYRLNVPLDLRELLPVDDADDAQHAKKRRNQSQADGGDGDEDAGEEFPQTRGRAIRRVQRLLRYIFTSAAPHANPYVSDLLPSDFFINHEDAAAADQDLAELLGSEDAAVLAAQQAAEAVKAARAREKEALLETQLKPCSLSGGGVWLYALYKYVDAAVQYRQARDALADALQTHRSAAQSGVALPDDNEAPEAEEEDDQNEEGLLDDEGQPDEDQVRALLQKVGQDSEETVVKMWEAVDARRRKELTELAVAFRKRQLQEIKNDEDEEEK